MKILSSPGLVVMAAFVGVVFCQTTPPQEQHHQIPVVGLGSVSPIGTSALRRLSSNSTRSSRESRRAGSAEADLVEALEADKEVTGEALPLTFATTLEVEDTLFFFVGIPCGLFVAVFFLLAATYLVGFCHSLSSSTGRQPTSSSRALSITVLQLIIV